MPQSSPSLTHKRSHTSAQGETWARRAKERTVPNTPAELDARRTEWCWTFSRGRRVMTMRTGASSATRIRRARSAGWKAIDNPKANEMLEQKCQKSYALVTSAWETHPPTIPASARATYLNLPARTAGGMEESSQTATKDLELREGIDDSFGIKSERQVEMCTASENNLR